MSIVLDRKYYKYTYQNWVQPILTSNTSSDKITVSATNEGQGNAYKAFDGYNSTFWCTANNVTSATLTAVLSKSLHVSSIEVTGVKNTYGSTNSITIYSDKTKQTIIGEKKNFDYSFSNKLVWIFDEPIQVDTLVFEGTGTTWVAIDYINIIAQEKTGYIESTINDYDFFKDIKVKDIYLGTQNTNCLTSVPNNIKLELDPLNATVVGSPTINNGVVSGFSDSNYLLTPSKPNSVSSFEMVFKIRASDITTNSENAIIGQQTTNRYTPQLAIDGQKFWFGVSTNGSSWTTVKGGTPEVNKDYWVKATWNGSQIELLVSENGSEYISLGTTTVSKVTWSELLRIGDDASTTDYFKGSIDLAQSYIKINNKDWWKGGTGALTLKAGSKIYVPNGFEDDGTTQKFNEVVTTKDVTAKGWTNLTGMCFFKSHRIDFTGNLQITSGTSATISGGNVWYDTSTNLVKRCNDSSTWTGGYSLPICIATSDNSNPSGSSGISSINQIFDWCGYIGSTAFVLPGVKGLMSNGFNADGTYNNIEYTVPSVITRQIDGSTGAKIWCLYSGNTIGFGVYDKTIQTLSDRPSSWTSGYYIYVKDENKIYVNQNASSSSLFVCGNITADSSSGKITSLTPATVQPLTTTRKINYIFKGSQLLFGKKELTFNVSNEIQSWVVPNRVKSLTVDCVASRGGMSTTTGNYKAGNYGNGGRVQCNLKVNPGQVLYFTVGAIPTDYKTASYNASDIRIGGTAYANRVIVAGGGGSGGRSHYQGTPGVGGAGGGLTGAQAARADWSFGGSGGTQTAGGKGGKWSGSGASYGVDGNNGNLGLGGNGKNYYGSPNNGDAYSGAGGAGYYGGGAGGGSAYYNYLSNSSGGGGSSYTNSSLCSNVTHTQGFNSGAGYIKITLNFS